MRIYLMRSKLVFHLFCYLLIFGTFKVLPLSASEQLIEEQLSHQRSDYIQGMLQEEIQLLSQYYAKDIRLMPEANPTVIGKNNAQLFFQELFSRFEINKYRREQTEILNMRTRIAEIGFFELEMTNQQGQIRQLAGKYLNLWCNNNGKITLLTDIWNFDHEIDFKQELFFANVESTITALEAHIPINSPISFEIAAYSALGDLTVPLGDAMVLTQFYSNDASVLPNFKPKFKGKDAIRTYWRNHVTELPAFEKLQNRTNMLEQAGKFIIEHYSHIANWRSGEYSGVSTGKHVRIWRREPHGGLKTYILISAYDG